MPVCKEKVQICTSLQKKVHDDKEETGDKPPLFTRRATIHHFARLVKLRSLAPEPKLYIHVIYPRPYFQTHTYRTYKFPISSIPFIEAVSADFARHMIAHPTKAQFIVD